MTAASAGAAFGHPKSDNRTEMYPDSNPGWSGSVRASLGLGHLQDDSPNNGKRSESPWGRSNHLGHTPARHGSQTRVPGSPAHRKHVMTRRTASGSSIRGNVGSWHDAAEGEGSAR